MNLLKRVQQKKKKMDYKPVLFCAFLSLFVLVSFQNCMEGFQAFDTNQALTAPELPPPFPAPQPEPELTKATISFELLSTCKNEIEQTPSASLVGSFSERMIKCLHVDQSSVLPKELSIEQITDCQTSHENNSGNVFDLALCLHKKNIPIMGYREFRQSDIDKCAVNSPQGSLSKKIIKCLNKENGLLPSLEGFDIEICLTNNNTDQLEKCLRAGGLLPTKDNSLQEEVSLCNKISGQGNLSSCLHNANMIPETVSQETINICISNLGLENIADCLKDNNFLAPSYSELISPNGVIGMNCIQCHNSTTANAGLNFEDFSTVSLRIDSNDPLNSLLLNRMKDTAMPMPPTGILQNINEIEQLILWLQNGAKND